MTTFNLFISFDEENETRKHQVDALRQMLGTPSNLLRIYTNKDKQSIENAHLCLFLITNSFIKSNICKRELIYAAKIGKTILCLILEEVSISECEYEIRFIMENCPCKQFNMLHSKNEFDHAKTLIHSHLEVLYTNLNSCLF